MVVLSEMETVLKKVAIAQRSSFIPMCPRCGREAMEHFCDSTTFGTLSRRADIYVCSACGAEEGLEDYLGNDRLPLSQWALFTGKVLGQSGTPTAEPLINNAVGYTAPSLYCLGIPDKFLIEGFHLKGCILYDGHKFLQSDQHGDNDLPTEDIYIVRHVENPADKNAVQLWYNNNGRRIRLGYVEAHKAPIAAKCPDNGGTD